MKCSQIKYLSEPILATQNKQLIFAEINDVIHYPTPFRDNTTKVVPVVDIMMDKVLIILNLKLLRSILGANSSKLTSMVVSVISVCVKSRYQS